MRGKINDKIIQKAVEVLGVEITQHELRLMPYIQFVMMNNQKIEPERINQVERDILTIWRKRGWIEGGASGLAISKDFWDAINEILWLGYVAHKAA